MAWLLGNLARDPEKDFFVSEELGRWAFANLGRILVVGPFESHATLNLTSKSGSTSGVYYSLVFQLPKWRYKVAKFDESVEVSPVHAQYYQLTIKQKEELEARIKAGLADAARAVADFELLKHDERKYLEFQDYFRKKDEHSLKAVFIDQVDMHTGDTAMRNIVQRWPTLIHDFMQLTDGDTDVDKVKDRLKISRAEAIVLITKNKLYQEWKRLFLSEVEDRLKRISGLVQGRKKSIDEYREWLKPHIARFRLLKQAFESPEGRMGAVTDFVSAGGHAISTATVTIWTWRGLEPPGLTRVSGEKKPYGYPDPYDNFIKRELIWHTGHGLVTAYPWLTEEWVDNAVKQIKEDWMDLWVHYYAFLEIKYMRGNFRMADGTEGEDGIFDINAILMSQNALLAKLLELKAKQQELERYINELLGIPAEPGPGKQPLHKPKKQISLGMRFLKRGPYERDFENRITKFYLKEMATGNYVPVVSFIKGKFGIG